VVRTDCRLFLPRLVKSRGDSHAPFADTGQERLPGVGQTHGAIETSEQRHAHQHFQGLDPLADGGRRGFQFLTGALKAQMPRGRFERLQLFRRRQTYHGMRR